MKYLVAIAISALSCLLSQALLACELNSLPNRDGRSQWYCSNSSSTVIVFVHGLNSNSADVWLYASEAASDDRVYWPELARDDPILAASDDANVSPSILLASFHTGPGSRSFSIADAQKQIFDALFSSIDGQLPAVEKKTIILVGHSLGGVLLRDVLSRNADRLLGKRLGLLLVASPSKGSTFANIAGYAQWAVDNTMVRELEKGSAYLDEVHTRFATTIADEGALRFLVGRELYEHLGMLEARARCASNTLSLTGVACAAKRRIANLVDGGPVVARDSAVVYWPETARLVPQSDHSTIAHPTDVGHPTHQALRELFGATRDAAVAPCKPPQNFRITFKMKTESHKCLDPDIVLSTPTFELMHLDIGDGAPLRPVMPLTFDPVTKAHRLRIDEPPFPCTDEVFWGKLVPSVQTSRRTSSELCSTDICFRRSRNAQAAKFALFNCVPGDKCHLPDMGKGVADGCRDKDRTPIMALEVRERRDDADWTSPSLETLERMPRQDRPGYTEFYITSEPITHHQEATSFGFAVYVNEELVRFDGLMPFFEKRPIGKGSRIHLTFPIENLGFRGGKDGEGYEDIKVAIKFFNGERSIGTATLRRRYVAYRHATAIQEADPETGVRFSWRAIYRPAASGRNFEVVLEHGGSIQWMRDRRITIDQLGKRFDDQPVIGVLRPGRVENNRIGMILGLVQKTGQVQALHTREEAAQICRWIREQPDLNTLQKKFSYIFEFPLETFDETQDRGRRVVFCPEV